MLTLPQVQVHNTLLRSLAGLTNFLLFGSGKKFSGVTVKACRSFQARSFSAVLPIPIKFVVNEK
jgi:hypothetical protein